MKWTGRHHRKPGTSVSPSWPHLTAQHEAPLDGKGPASARIRPRVHEVFLAASASH